MGVAALTRMVPAGLAAPLAGVLADRCSRRDVLLGSIALRALILAGIGAAVAADAPLAVVLVLAAMFTIVATAHKPAQAALLPSLVETPRQLAASNAVWSAVDNAAFLVGAALSGALIATMTMAASFLVTAALFGLATVPVALIARDPVPDYRARSGGDRLRPVHDAIDGFREVAGDGSLRLVVGVLSISTAVEGAIDVLVVLVAIDMLGLGGAGVGWLNACWGFGGVIGGAGGAHAAPARATGRRAVGGRAARRDPADADRPGGVGRGDRRDAGGAGRRVRADRGGGPVAAPAAACERRARPGVCGGRELVLDHHRPRGDPGAGDRRRCRAARRAADRGRVPADHRGTALAAAVAARGRDSRSRAAFRTLRGGGHVRAAAAGHARERQPDGGRGPCPRGRGGRPRGRVRRSFLRRGRGPA